MTELTAKKRRLFLQTLEETTNVAAACRAIKMSRQGVYNWRKHDTEFAEEWDAALNAALDQLEQTAVERAHAGSDLLMMFLLKANRPAKYRESVKHELSGSEGGQPINVQFFTFNAVAAALTDGSAEDR